MLGIDAVLTAGLKLIDKVIPDPQAKAEHQLKLMKLHQDGELSALNAEVTLLAGQLEINKEEAKSTNWFVSGWRPGVGWTCASALAYTYVVQPLLVFVISVTNPEFDITKLPEIDTMALMPVLMGMLGLSWNRTEEKKAGVSRG